MHPYSLPYTTPRTPRSQVPSYDDKGLTYDNKGFTVGGRDLDWPCGSHLSYDDKGFTVGGRDLDSSILCVGDVALCWSPSCLADVTPDSLALFQLIRPQPELLLLGTGQRMQAVPGELREFVRACGMKLEVLSTVSGVLVALLLLVGCAMWLGVWRAISAGASKGLRDEAGSALHFEWGPCATGVGQLCPCDWGGSAVPCDWGGSAVPCDWGGSAVPCDWGGSAVPCAWVGLAQKNASLSETAFEKIQQLHAIATLSLLNEKGRAISTPLFPSS
ncbi:unnamed protein product [Closterium sp. NIES-64]|nr:unnamed protein product [Closterium sp. NIES-64]